MKNLVILIMMVISLSSYSPKSCGQTVNTLEQNESMSSFLQKMYDRKAAEQLQQQQLQLQQQQQQFQQEQQRQQLLLQQQQQQRQPEQQQQQQQQQQQNGWSVYNPDD